MTNFEKVGLFMKTFGQEVKVKASFSSDKINKLRIDLIEEELEELKDAIKKKASLIIIDLKINQPNLIYIKNTQIFVKNFCEFILDSYKGKIIAIVSKGDTEVKKIADHYIEIPKCDELLVPLLATVPLQLLSYHIAVMRGCNVDQPRNLAKSVTVE